MKILKISILSLIFIALTVFGQTAFAKAPDAKEDGTGWCDGLDKKGGLFSTCIRAHSAKNLVEHLISVGVEGPALNNAEASLEQAVSAYEELAGAGNSLPGLSDNSCFLATDFIGATDSEVNDVNWWAPICTSFGGTESECADENLYYMFVEPLHACTVQGYETCDDADFGVKEVYSGNVNVCNYP